jgi:formamidopyrimidine-DNA glycosylase
MPELPEVETIKRGLSTNLGGRAIAGVDIRWVKAFLASERDIERLVVGHRIVSLDRHAKVLVLNLDSEYSLLVHLKMTGQFVLVKVDGARFAGGHPSESMARDLPDSSTRVIFTFDDGDKLFFNDQRKFGWIKLIRTEDVAKDAFIRRLGPEPLTDEFTLTGFQAKLARHGRAPVKAVVLDQSTVAGVGNIYADESLNLARIHPARLSGTLTAGEAKRLYTAIKEIISSGVKYGGTSFAHYVNALGGGGDYLEHARVYRRQGKPCPKCGDIIVKSVVAGRGTHTCPTCQPVPKTVSAHAKVST